MTALRVLVIDDEPDVLLLCRVNFETAGHEVLEAADGERGLELAASERPDVILLDLMLPRRDGFSVLEELGTLPATSELPVLLLTAKVGAKDQRRGLSAGAVAYVTKPFSPVALTELAENVNAMSEGERRSLRGRRLATLEEGSR